MRKIATILLLVLAVTFSLAGCGGGGGGSSSSESETINFVGTWTGSVVITSSTPDKTYAATLKVTSQSSGIFSATINVGSSGDMSANGTISINGSSFTLKYTRSDGLIVNASGTASTTTISGTFSNTVGEEGTFNFTKS